MERVEERRGGKFCSSGAYNTIREADICYGNECGFLGRPGDMGVLLVPVDDKGTQAGWKPRKRREDGRASLRMR